MADDPSATGASSTQQQRSDIPNDPVHYITEANFCEYLNSAAVNELFIVDLGEGTYRLEVSLTWRPGRSVVVVARGGERTWRSIDTLVKFLRSCGVGKTVLKMQLRK